MQTFSAGQSGNPQETARAMIGLYGLRAHAVAQERAAEMRQNGDKASFERWEAVQTAIRELRNAAGQDHGH